MSKTVSWSKEKERCKSDGARIYACRSDDQHTQESVGHCMKIELKLKVRMNWSHREVSQDEPGSPGKVGK